MTSEQEEGSSEVSGKENVFLLMMFCHVTSSRYLSVMTMYEAMKLLTVESRYSHLYCNVQESDVFVDVQTHSN